MKVNELMQTYGAEIADGIITFPSIKSKDEYIEYSFMIYKYNEIPKSSHDFVNAVSGTPRVLDNEVWVLQIDFRKDSKGHTSFVRGGWNHVVETFEELYYSIGYTFKYLTKQ